MITELPSHQEFRDSGIALLNLAWDQGARLLKDLDQSGFYGVDREEAAPRYWEAARQQLDVALVLAHQGAEFLLKSKIAAVSPYLLIASQPRDWPKRCAQVDTPFAEFRTLDAQDLVKVHDTVCQPRLEKTFVEELDAIRRKRAKWQRSLVSAALRRIKYDNVQVALPATEAWLGG